MPSIPVLAIIAGIVLLALGIHVVLAICLIAIPLGLLVAFALIGAYSFSRVWKKHGSMFGSRF